MQHQQRSIYLSTLPIPEALASIKDHLDRAVLGVQTLPAAQAAGHVLASAVHARYSSPNCHSAAMDGIAVRARDTFAAREGHPIRLLRESQYVPVNTGNVLPSEYDAVIMVEHLFAEPGAAYGKKDMPQAAQAESVWIEAPAAPWQHVRRIGEDIVATELLFPRNHLLTPYDIGALLTAGIWELSVWEPLRIRIIPTGDEILDASSHPEPVAGHFVDSNSHMLSALAQFPFCHVERLGPVPDKLEAITAALEYSIADGVHVTLLCAGSSAGSKDYSRSAIAAVGDVVVHGIAVMPGKPSILGAAKGRLIAGVPGYPISAAVCFTELVTPLVHWLAHAPLPQQPSVPVRFARKVPSRPGVEEFILLAVGKIGSEYSASPLSRGAGNTSSLAKAQAVASIPMNAEGINAGDVLTARLLQPLAELDRTIICIGSHDTALDLLADELMAHDPAVHLASSHVGSMGGISALRDKSCLMAGMHLFDPESGDFNAPFLRKYMSLNDIVLINLAIREQGLIIAKGNPKQIQGLSCLTRPGIRYANRQRGAGTRVLFDYHTSVAGIKADQIDGYRTEETTHMAVAVNVLTGAADCGLGILSAAKALDLDFIPIAHERYDLAIPVKFVEDVRVKAVRDMLHTSAFLERIRAQGGYDTRLTGLVMEAGMALGDGRSTN